MGERETDRSSTTGAGGIFAHALDLLAAALAYSQARFALANLEGREALSHYLKTLVLLLGGVVVLVFGYFFLCFAGIFAIATAMGGGTAWIWATLGAAVLHFVLGAILLTQVRALVHRPVFEATMDEFRKDQAWLESKTGRRN